MPGSWFRQKPDAALGSWFRQKPDARDELLLRPVSDETSYKEEPLFRAEVLHTFYKEFVEFVA